MADKVDVLAVLDREIARAGGESYEHGRDLIAARAAVASAFEALENIARRAAPHPDDTDEDRKRNLYHCEAIANWTLVRIGGAK